MVGRQVQLLNSKTSVSQDFLGRPLSRRSYCLLRARAAAARPAISLASLFILTAFLVLFASGLIYAASDKATIEYINAQGNVQKSVTVTCSSTCPGGNPTYDFPSPSGATVGITILDSSGNTYGTFNPSCSVSCSGNERKITCSPFTYNACPASGMIRARTNYPAFPASGSCDAQPAESVTTDLYNCGSGGKKRETTCSYNYQECLSPGWVSAKVTFDFNEESCTGQKSRKRATSFTKSNLYLCPEYGQIKIYHETAGLIQTINNIQCSTSCPCTGENCQRQTDCTYNFPKSSCTIPGKYKAEATVTHAMPECDGKTSGVVGSTSSVTKHDLFTCDIKDKGTYYVYPPGVTNPKTSGYAWKKDVDCTASCASDKVYTSTCPSTAIDKSAICTNKGGYYSVNSYIQHKGKSCINGGNNYVPNSWSDNTNLKAFSCGLDASAKVSFYVGSKYFINNQVMTCPDVIVDYPGNDNDPKDVGLHSCTYTAWTPPAGTYVTVGGVKRYCQKEGDYKTKVVFTFSGKNWDGTNLHSPSSHLKETLETTNYNVNWDGDSGNYCKPTTPCFSDKTSGDSGIGWNLGGEVAATTCCGDDGSEWYRTCSSNELVKNACNGDGVACCSHKTDCVSKNTCYAHNWQGDADGDSATEKCNSGTWEDVKEYAQIRVYHETVGLLKTQNSVLCTTTCPWGTGADAQSYQECSWSYSSTGCKIPGKYQAEMTLDHNRPTCSGLPMASGVPSQVGRHDLFTCNIIDKGTYYVYPPGVTGPKTTGYSHRKYVDCPASCPSDKVYTSSCPAYNIPEAAICTKRTGFYTVNTRVQHKGYSCLDGNALHHTTSWADNTNVKAFSCGLDTTMKVTYKGGSHTYVSNAAMSCPADQFSHDPTDNSALIECSYTGWTPTKYVTVSGQKRQCDYEGDHVFTVTLSFSGKNWDGSTLGVTSQTLTNNLYNVNWDAHSGTYCPANSPCFTDKTTGSLDSGIAWNIGGETAASTCCGDDSNEWYRTCATNEAIKNACNGDNKACCNAQKDCVAYGSCYNNGVKQDVDGDGATEFCLNGVWEDSPEYAQVRIYHEATGNNVIKTINNVLCTTNTCASTASETQRYHECSTTYYDCKIPGWYKAETTIDHKRAECDGSQVDPGKQSAIPRHNLYNCVIKDKMRYYVYAPGTTSPSTGTYAHRSGELECDASCSSGSRVSNCNTYNFNWADFCTSRNGYYTSNAYITHVGNNCIDGGALKHKTSWVDSTNLKVFSCSLVLSAKTWFWVGSTYFVNNKDMSCPQVVAINPATDEGGIQHVCTYTGYTPPADKSVTVGGNNHYCRIEGDYKTKVKYTFTGKNWDGVAMQGNTNVEERTRTQYTVNWDTQDYCHKDCVNKNVWWSIHSNDGGSRHLCCGDDANEFRITNNADSTDACCDQSNDCSYSNKCVTNGGCAHTALTVSNAATSGEYCKAGTWVDLDDHSNYCKACHGNSHYNIGGEIAKCCGDDAGEYRKVSNADSTDACCNNNNDCTNGNTCYSQGSCLQTNHAGSNEADYRGEYCQAGTWRDQDDSATYCNACGSNKYNIGGDISKCCEDDANEFIRICETTEDAGAGCAGSSDNLACCNQNTDCVFNGACYNNGWSGDVDNDLAKEKCTNGKWSDSPEYAQVRIYHSAGGQFYTFNNVLCTSTCPGASGYVTPPQGQGDIKLRIMDQSNNVIDTFFPECSISCSGGKRVITCAPFTYTACPVSGVIRARLDFPAYGDESGCKSQAAESTAIVDLYTCAEGGKERVHGCSYDFNECYVPGVYQAEATINHNRGNCDGMPMVAGGTSVIGRHNLYTCTITDHVRYYAYTPSGAQAWKSAKKDCTTVCHKPGDKYERKTDCPAVAVPETSFCTKRNGYYTTKAFIEYTGRNCYNQNFYANNEWFNYGNTFSCALDSTMTVTYKGGSHTYFSNKAMSCPADQFSHDPTNHNANVECTYTGWTPTKYVTVGGQNRQCDYEGDHVMTVRVSYSGKNWDGSTLEDSYQDLSNNLYNVNWDAHSGTYCPANSPCFTDKTTGSMDSGIAWNIGGEIAASSCCGDDNNEWYRTCTSDEMIKNACYGDNKACCTTNKDCVSYGSCYNNGHKGDVDSDGAIEWCVNGIWQDAPEYAEIRIYHEATGNTLYHKFTGVLCSSTCSSSASETERYHECKYDFQECKIPGWYRAEVDVEHKRLNCDGTKIETGKVSAFPRQNINLCVIKDKVRYYFYVPGTTNPSTGTYAHRSGELECDASCSSGSRVSNCNTYNFNWADFCTSRNGYYTSNAYVTHVGNNCINGGALKHKTSWVDNTNLKSFSCSLVLSAKTWFWVGSTYFVNNKDMSCPQVVAINPATDEGGIQHVCTYTGYTPPADKSVTVGGNNHYCRIEGDYKTKVKYTFTGKNWDGVAMQGNTNVEERTRTQYTVNWDTKDYCHKDCVNKNVWWAIGSNDGGSRTKCCGDDANEFRITNNADSTDACCDQSNDCSYSNKCVTNGGCAHTALTVSNAAANGEYCNAGTWKDLDDKSSYCAACHGNTHYNIGGEIAKCCGDDAGEYRKVSNADSTDACCNNNNDCTNSNTCYSQGSCLHTALTVSNEADYSGEYCQGGTWRDQDESATYCNGCGSNKYNIGGDIAKCCEDDANEFIRTCQTTEENSKSCDRATDKTDVCCDKSNDCVYNGKCYAHGTASDVDNDNSKEKCDQGTWKDNVEYATIKVHHQSAGLVHTQNNVACTSSCPSGTGQYAQRQQDCPFVYNECLIPGWYKAEATIIHDRPNCDSSAMIAGTTSTIGMHNLYECKITDHVDYHVYDVKGNEAWHSGDKDCTTSCVHNGKDYGRNSDCAPVTFPEAAICSSRDGFYYVRAEVKKTGRACNNKAFLLNPVWVRLDNIFSCSLVLNAKTWFWVGGHYFVNGKAMSCNQPIVHDIGNKEGDALHDCKYTAYTPAAGTFVTVGGSKNYCRIEGDYKTKVEYTFTGKNWDGEVMQGNTNVESRTRTQYTVNWDTKDYCHKNCVNKDVWWSIGTNDGGSRDKCCGDDSNEFRITNNADSTDACCDKTDDCSFANKCYSNGGCAHTPLTVSNAAANGEYCKAGTWVDLDDHSNYCAACHGNTNYNIGGEIAKCCGDDAGEYRKVSNADSTDACCNNNNDCTSGNTCYSQGTCLQTSHAGSNEADYSGEYCQTGTWRDQDDSATYCNACGSNKYNIGGDIAKCCEDDANEFIRICETAEDAGAGCALSSDNLACCNQNTDCVFNGNCYNHAWSGDIDNDFAKEKCMNGKWTDSPEYAQIRVHHSIAGHIYTFNDVLCASACPSTSGFIIPPVGQGDIKLRIMDQNNNIVDTFYPECSISCSGGKRVITCAPFKYTACPVAGKVRARLDFPAYPNESGCKSQAAESTDIVDLYTCAVGNKERTHDCPFDFYECYVPGTYKAEATIYHNRGNCDGMPMVAGGTSVIGKHNLYTCTITDHIDYHVYHPNGVQAWHSGDKACSTSCVNQGGTYKRQHGCPARPTVPIKDICTSRDGYYTGRDELKLNGRDCYNKAFPANPAWTDRGKEFSCSLDTTGKVRIYSSNGVTLLDWTDMSCPAEQYSFDPADHKSDIPCTYAWDPTPYVSVGGQNQRCNVEGDIHMVTRFLYSGNNWDGTPLKHGSTVHDTEDLDINMYNIDWDGHSGTFCKSPLCFPDLTTGSKDKGIAWNIGGEVHGNKCCGDDANEWYRFCETTEEVATACDRGADDLACCNDKNDCVYNNGCYNNGYNADVDGDKAKEKCENGVWKENPEYAQFRVFHDYAGKIYTLNNVECSSTCPNKNSYTERGQSCPYDFYECLAPGWYSVEGTLYHDRANCDSTPMIGSTTSAFGRVNMYNCVITDEVRYKVISPNTGKVYQSDRTCSTGCVAGGDLQEINWDDTQGISSRRRNDAADRLLTCSAAKPINTCDEKGWYKGNVKYTYEGKRCDYSANMPATEEFTRNKLFYCYVNSPVNVDYYIYDGSGGKEWNSGILACHAAGQLGFCANSLDISSMNCPTKDYTLCKVAGMYTAKAKFTFESPSCEGLQVVPEEWHGPIDTYRCSPSYYRIRAKNSGTIKQNWELMTCHKGSCTKNDNKELDASCTTEWVDTAHCDEEGDWQSQARFNFNKECDGKSSDVSEQTIGWDTIYTVDWDVEKYCTTVCTGKTVYWDIGGVGGTRHLCCQDDASEYKKDCASQEKQGSNACSVSTDDRACCDQSNDCVYQNICYNDKWEGDVDGDGHREYCAVGTWRDLPIVTAKITIQNLEKVQITDATVSCSDVDCGVSAGTSSCAYNNGNDKIECTFFSQASGVWCTGTCSYSYNSCTMGGIYSGHVNFKYTGWNMAAAAFDEATRYLVTGEQSYYHCGYTTTATVWVFDPDSTVIDNAGMSCGLTKRNNGYAYGTTVCDYSFNPDGTNYFDLTSTSYTPKKPPTPSADIVETRNAKYCRKEGDYDAKVRFAYTGTMFGNSPGEMPALTATSQEYTETLYTVNWDQSDGYWCDLACFDDQTAEGRGIEHAIGGDDKQCCGDDADNWIMLCESKEKAGVNLCVYSTDDKACCNEITDCVFNDKCYNDGFSEDLDYDDMPEFCDEGIWKDMPGIASKIWIWNQENVRVEDHSMTCGTVMCGPVSGTNSCTYDEPTNEMVCDYYLEGCIDCTAPCFYGYNECTIGGWYYGYTQYTFTDIPCGNERNIGERVYPVSYAQPLGPTPNMWYYCGYTATAKLWFNTPVGPIRAGQDMTCGPLTYRTGGSPNGKTACSYQFKDPVNTGTHFWTIDSLSTSPTSGSQTWTENDLFCRQEGEYSTDVTYYYTGRMFNRNALTATQQTIHKFLYHVNWDDELATNKAPDGSSDPSRYCGPKCVSDTTINDEQNNLLDGSKDGIAWGIGGDDGGTRNKCCGDDANEFIHYCKSLEHSAKACKGDQVQDVACCDKTTDCVANDKCYDNMWEGDVDGDGANEYCHQSSWKDLPRVTAKIWIASPEKTIRDGVDITCSALDCGVAGGTTSCTYPDNSDSLICTFYSTFTGVSCVGTCTYTINECTVGGAYDGHVEFTYQGWNSPTESFSLKTQYANVVEHDQYYYFCGYETESLITIDKPTGRVIDHTGMTCDLTFRNGNSDQGTTHCGYIFKPDGTNYFDIDAYSTSLTTWNWARTYRDHYCREEGDYKLTIDFSYHGENNRHTLDRDRRFDDTPNADDPALGITKQHQEVVMYKVSWDDDGDVNLDPDGKRDPARYCDLRCFNDRTPPATKPFDKGIGWEQGGDIGKCCGDDDNEWMLDCRSEEKVGANMKSACASSVDNNRACCNEYTDCVANNKCFNDKWEGNVDSDAMHEYCHQGVWKNLPKVTAKLYIQSPKDRQDGTYFDSTASVKNFNCTEMDCGVASGITSCSYPYDDDTVTCTYYSADFLSINCKATCTQTYWGCKTGGTYDGKTDFVLEGFDGTRDLAIDSSYTNAAETNQQYYYFCGYDTTSTLTFKRPGATVFTDQDMSCDLTSRDGTKTHGLATCTKTVTDSSVSITALDLTAKTTGYASVDVTWNWKNWYCKWEGDYKATVTSTYHGEKDRKGAWSEDRKDRRFGDSPISDNDLLTNGAGLSHPGHRVTDLLLYSVDWDDKKGTNKDPSSGVDSPSVYCRLDCFDDKTTVKGDFGIGWNLGGDAPDGKTTCCGDDNNEFYLKYFTTDVDGPFSQDVVDQEVAALEPSAMNKYDACCDKATDCVWDNQCYPHGVTICIAVGQQQDIRKCDNNVWKTIQTCADGHRCQEGGTNRLLYLDGSCVDSTPKGSAKCEYEIDEARTVQCRSDAVDCPEDEQNADGSCKSISDADRGDDTKAPGVCIDYLGCSDNVCAKRIYRDTCRSEGDTWVFEYLRSGATCIGHWVDCEGHEYNKCATELITEDNDTYNGKINIYNAFGINYQCKLSEKGRGFCWDQERLPATLTNFTCDPFVCDVESHKCTDFCTKAKHCAGGEIGRSICIEGDEDPDKGVCGFSCRPIDNAKWYRKWDPLNPNADPTTGEYKGLCCNQITISGNLWGTFYIEMFREPPATIISNTTMDMIVYTFPEHVKFAETSPRVYGDGSFETKFEKAGELEKACFDVGQYFLEVVLPDYEVSTTKLLTVSTKEDGRSLKVQIGDLTLDTGS